MKPFFLLFLFLLAWAAAPAQSISGRISNARNQEALPFANIGVVGKALGTVADEQGAYQLPFQEALANETVRVSSVGYAPRTLTLRELAAHPNVALSPEAVALNEVRVNGRAQFRRAHTLGNTGKSANSTSAIKGNHLGWQMGTVIKLSRRPARVLNANFNIARTSAGQVTFRVNLYRLDAEGRPSETKLLTHDVIVAAPLTKGLISVDLAPFEVLVNEDFFLAIEVVKWPTEANADSELAFSAGLGYANNEIYTRRASQSAWERTSVGALLAGMQPKLSFYVTVND